jgi:hypothetical protein
MDLMRAIVETARREWGEPHSLRLVSREFNDSRSDDGTDIFLAGLRRTVQLAAAIPGVHDIKVVISELTGGSLYAKERSVEFRVFDSTTASVGLVLDQLLHSSRAMMKEPAAVGTRFAFDVTVTLLSGSLQLAGEIQSAGDLMRRCAAVSVARCVRARKVIIRMELVIEPLPGSYMTTKLMTYSNV